MDVLEQLNRVLDEARIEPDLAHVAKAMGISVRTLQRQLRERGTSFRRELCVTRVRHAQRLMVSTGMTLTRVALEAGFSSPARLSVAFRRVERVSPSAWRRART